jgi:polar amino acid transport system substrate-binding protein
MTVDQLLFTQVSKPSIVIAAERCDVPMGKCDSLPSFVAEFPRSHIVDGGFQQTGIAIAVPKGHPEALAYLTKFIEDAKASGSVRRAMDRAGMANLAVTPPAR